MLFKNQIEDSANKEKGNNKASNSGIQVIENKIKEI
jgi:hypothetical protein